MKSFAKILLIALLLAIALPAGAQEDNDPALVIVNYAEIDETDGQTLRVYFTLVDGLNRAISAPTVNAAQAIFNNQLYNGVVTVPQTPLYLTLVLDTSGSMRTDAALVRQVATEAVNTAPQGTRFSIIQFNQQIITRVGFSDDRNAVIEAINTLTDDQFAGGTCLYDATFDALEAIQAAAPAGRRAVIVFTDGRDELVAGGGLDPCSTRADFAHIVETARNPQVRVPIYTIGLSGTQVINQEELATLATSTGGLSAFGGQAELSRLFLQIIQALAAQRQATFETCVPTGQYGGLFNVDTEGGSLNAPLAALNYATTCVIPTLTPSPSPTFTPEPLALAISSFRFNAQTNTIDFDIERGGAGDVSEYRVEIVNRATGFRVQGDYGLLVVPASGDGTVRVPLDQVPALEWRVTVSAYDASGGLLARSAPAELAPERTPTPTFTASITPTITPTFTPTATPLVPEINISSVQFLQDSGEFILNLQLLNLTPEIAPGYTIRIENAAGIQVASETRMTTPTNRVNVPARDNDNRLLPTGEYTLFIEIPTSGSQPLRAARQVVVPPPPPTATPTPLPSTTERLVENVSSNPTLATGLILFAVGGVVLIIFFAFRFGRRRGDYRRRAFQESFSAAAMPESHTDVQDMSGEAGAEGVILRAMASPHHVFGREWEYSLATIVREGLVIGKGAGIPGIVYLDLVDPGVSKLHATIGYEGGQYWIRDDGSTNGTFIDQQRLTSGQRYPLQSGQIIRFGLNTQLEFVTHVQSGQPADAAPYLLPATDLPRGVSARITIVQSPDPNMQGGRTFEISTREFTIGRGPSNDLTLNAEGVSKVHVTIRFVNNQFVITDQRSTNNTMLDGERLPALDPIPLISGKEYTIMLGQKTRLQFSYHMVNPPELRTEMEATKLVPVPGAAPSAPAHDDTVTFVADESLPANVEAEVELLNQAGDSLGTQRVTSAEVTIGRKSTNVLVLDNAEVSRLHAHLFWREGSFYFEDLDSGNGTFLDGQRIRRREPVALAQGKFYDIRLGRESAAIRFGFRYIITPPPESPQLQGDEDEPTQVPEE